MFCIKDDGIGFPESYNDNQNNTLGMSLMKGLADQLGGNIVIKSDRGVSVTVIFPKSLEENAVETQ